MLAFRTLPRFFHTSTTRLASDKSSLATLRKKTGYTFSNCKKALEIHNNDLVKAEEWLRKQAQALGWSKATKLEGRQTSQGLIGVTVDNHEGVLLEVNCETDFVARNAEFGNMVKEAAETCMNYLKQSPNTTHDVTKISLDAEQLKSLKTADGKTLADKLALMIGTVGENATLKRALGLKVSNGVHLIGYAHPSGKSASNVLLGRIGGVVAIRSRNHTQIEQVGLNLCQHVVGMAPKAIGRPDDEPAANKEDETNLLNQDYLLDDSYTVKEFLDEHFVEVVDFQRFECGENVIAATADQCLESVQVCQ